MDMLSWTKLTPTCKVRDTVKLFYGQYLYKAVLHIPLAGVIRQDKNSKLSIESLVDIRKTNYKKFNLHSNWITRSTIDRRTQYTEVDIDQLKYWQRAFLNHKDQLKHRIEEPWIQVYGNDEQLMYDLIKHNKKSLTEFYRPKNDDSRQILQSNQIIVKKPTDYQYKIYLKEGYNLSADMRTSLAQYFDSLGDDVKLTKAVYHNLFTRKLWFTGGYFYAKDDKILTFLSLMAPGFISGIFRQVYQPS